MPPEISPGNLFYFPLFPLTVVVVLNCQRPTTMSSGAFYVVSTVYVVTAGLSQKMVANAAVRIAID